MAATIINGPLVKISGAPAPRSVRYPTAAARNSANDSSIGAARRDVPDSDGEGSVTMWRSVNGAESAREMCLEEMQDLIHAVEERVRSPPV